VKNLLTLKLENARNVNTQNSQFAKFAQIKPFLRKIKYASKKIVPKINGTHLKNLSLAIKYHILLKIKVKINTIRVKFRSKIALDVHNYHLIDKRTHA
jgi:hypothetical protein